MVIDFQIHFEPEESIRPYLGPNDSLHVTFAPDGRTKHFAFAQRFDVDHHIRMMDEAGVNVAVLSSMEGMREDIHLCRVVNDRARMWQERYPDRIRPMAHIPPLGGPEAFAELDRCVQDLGYRGAAVRAVIGGKELDDPALWPFYEKLRERDLFLFIHPGFPKSAYLENPDYDLARSAAREGHLQCVLVRLINGGVLDDFPGLKIVFSHLAGGFVANLARILHYQDKQFWGTAGFPPAARTCKRPFEEYLGEIYYDTGGIIGDTDAIRMALMKLSPRNIVFGTDYPMEIRDPQVIRRFIQDIRALPLGPEDVDGILGNNARSLIGV